MASPKDQNWYVQNPHEFCHLDNLRFLWKSLEGIFLPGHSLDNCAVHTFSWHNLPPIASGGDTRLSLRPRSKEGTVTLACQTEIYKSWLPI
jgi:hypothetical protein